MGYARDKEERHTNNLLYIYTYTYINVMYIVQWQWATDLSIASINKEKYKLCLFVIFFLLIQVPQKPLRKKCLQFLQCTLWMWQMVATIHSQNRPWMCGTYECSELYHWNFPPFDYEFWNNRNMLNIFDIENTLDNKSFRCIKNEKKKRNCSHL